MARLYVEKREREMTMYSHKNEKDGETGVYKSKFNVIA